MDQKPQNAEAKYGVVKEKSCFEEDSERERERDEMLLVLALLFVGMCVVVFFVL